METRIPDGGETKEDWKKDRSMRTGTPVASRRNRSRAPTKKIDCSVKQPGSHLNIGSKGRVPCKNPPHANFASYVRNSVEDKILQRMNDTATMTDIEMARGGFQQIQIDFDGAAQKMPEFWKIQIEMERSRGNTDAAMALFQHALSCGVGELESDLKLFIEHLNDTGLISEAEKSDDTASRSHDDESKQRSEVTQDFVEYLDSQEQHTANVTIWERKAHKFEGVRRSVRVMRRRLANGQISVDEMRTTLARARPGEEHQESESLSAPTDSILLTEVKDEEEMSESLDIDCEVGSDKTISVLTEGDESTVCAESDDTSVLDHDVVRTRPKALSSGRNLGFAVVRTPKKGREVTEAGLSVTPVRRCARNENGRDSLTDLLKESEFHFVPNAAITPGERAEIKRREERERDAKEVESLNTLVLHSSMEQLHGMFSAAALTTPKATPKRPVDPFLCEVPENVAENTETPQKKPIEAVRFTEFIRNTPTRELKRFFTERTTPIRSRPLRISTEESPEL